MSRHTARTLKMTAAFLALCLIAVVMLFPLVYMGSTALKAGKEVRQYPPTILPKHIEWKNFADVFSFLDLVKYGKNSLIVTLSVVVCWTLSSSLVAFGFARYRAKFKEGIFVVLLATIMIPYPAVMIPQFLLFNRFGWVDTYLPLIVPTMFGSSYYIFMLRQFFSSLGGELFEAARMDGCTEFRQWWNIGMPLCFPALATVSIFAFIWTWNDLLAPVIYLNTMDKYTLPIALVGVKSMYVSIKWNMIMMAALFTVAPVVLMFLSMQRFFVESLTFSGVKG